MLFIACKFWLSTLLKDTGCIKSLLLKATNSLNKSVASVNSIFSSVDTKSTSSGLWQSVISQTLIFCKSPLISKRLLFPAAAVDGCLNFNCPPSKINSLSKLKT